MLTTLLRRRWFQIFIIALVLRISFLFFANPSVPTGGDAPQYLRLGTQLYQGLGFVSETGDPTSWRPPLYPLLIALVYSIFGEHLLWVRIVQILLGSLLCILIYFISSLAYSDSRISTMSSAAAAIYPTMIHFDCSILTETFFSFLFAGCIFLLFLQIKSGRDIFILWSSILLGLAVLTRSMIILFIPFLFLWWLLRTDITKKRQLKGIGITFIILFIICLPWTIRNYFVQKAIVPISTVGGITFYNSYIIPEEGFGFNSLEGIGSEYFQLQTEAEQSRYLVRLTLSYIMKNKWKVARLSVKKLLLLIYPFDALWYDLNFGSRYNIVWGLMFPYAIAGIILSKKTEYLKVFGAIIAFLLVNSVVFYGSPRFRLEIDPYFMVLGSAGFFELGKLRKGRYVSFSIVTANGVAFLLGRTEFLAGILGSLRAG